MKVSSPRRNESPDKKFQEENAKYAERIADLEAELHETKRAKLKLLKQVVAMKNGKYAEEIAKLRKEMADVKASINEISKSNEIIEQLRAENDQLLQIRNSHDADLKLIEECKSISEKGEVSEAFYDKLERLEQENAELKRKLAEQSASNDEIFEKAEDQERIGIAIQSAGISFTPKEALIALKFRLHQLQDEHDTLVDAEEDSEDEEDFDENDLQELRKKINQLQLKNSQLNKVPSPNTSNSASPQFIESIIREIQSLSEKNAALRAAGSSKNFGKTKEYAELRKLYEELLSKSPQKIDNTGATKLFDVLKEFVSRIDRELSSEDYSIDSEDEEKNSTIENLKSQIEYLNMKLETLDRKGAPDDAATLFRENRELREEIFALKNQMSMMENIDEPILGGQRENDFPKFDRGAFKFFTRRDEIDIKDDDIDIKDDEAVKNEVVFDEEDEEEELRDENVPFRSNVDIDNDEPHGHYFEETEEEDEEEEKSDNDQNVSIKIDKDKEKSRELLRQMFMKTLSQNSDNEDSSDNMLGVEPLTDGEEDMKWEEEDFEEEEEESFESIRKRVEELTRIVRK